MGVGRPIGRPFGGTPGVVLAAGAVLAVLLSLSCGGSPVAPTPVAALPSPPPPPPPSPSVAILSVDGLRSDALAKAEAPTLRGLMARGAFTLRARTVLPAQTLPAHVSMLSGQDPKVHKVLWDDWKAEKGFVSVPTVFSIAKAAGKRTVMVAGKEKFRHFGAPGVVDSLQVVGGGDAVIANQAIVEAGVGFDLLFVHFPDVDLTGHEMGWMSAPYLAAVEAADAAIGRVLAALPRGVTVIVTADHGGKGRNHGQDISEDMTIPWIAVGPRVAVRGELGCSVKQTDTAATALYVLGLRLPEGAPAEVVQDAFVQP